ncbi:putative Regulatory protein Ral2 [Taphrina deformans PYCC 5710]|uniref:Regulatory protein Ral2 n=1 Tax=Taphrina deformans (strain PYCC 5710 / ATCC 11124 / CBS 356.35 / IMI 108563 / JCM 9778 / NBRC 8474) TaxID=1097556 RepID=R4XAX5_TAPDE|nr:putative Regulatory protein Ral2 [Taphrina deformans PYCC 5710]|eukprot:CCG81478.1 putative Regulatory protein Ral2 [Taphrina deformans PYCC 5710]
MVPLLELSQNVRKTTGEVPPASVGSTVTVVGKKLYVVAGRLVTSRILTSSIYALDLETFVWRHIEVTIPTRPAPRYFHSANVHGSSIVIFGGMSTNPEGDGFCVLNDVAIFDTTTEQWTLGPEADLDPPLRPRYAHLSSVSAGKLVVLGGQDKQNEYLEDAAIFNLTQVRWEGVYALGKQCGAYRSLSVTSTLQTREPYPVDAAAELERVEEADMTTSVSPVSSRSSWNGNSRPGMTLDTSSSRRPSQVSQHSSTSQKTTTTPHRPNLKKKGEAQGIEQAERAMLTGAAHPIYLYSNFNFVDVERYLHIIPPPTDGFQLQDHSQALSGEVLPPGLRFPSGNMVGDHLIISGTYLTNTSQDFAVWALNLKTNTWQRIEVCDRFSVGSWNKGIYCDALERFIILGHRDRSLVEDYNHRQANFDHVTVLDLEPFGIYEPTGPTISPLAQQLGFFSLADAALCDMELVTADQTTIDVSSEVMGRRWPGYLDQMRASDPRRPSVASTAGGNRTSTMSRSSVTLARADERLRSLYVPYPHAVVAALVRFLYTDALPPALPDRPACALLLLLHHLDRTRSAPVLQRCAKVLRQRLARDLTPDTAPLVHETALVSGSVGLQVHAARVMAQSPAAATPVGPR